MKTFARIALLVLALVMMFTFVACNNEDDVPEDTTTATPETTTQAPVTTPAPETTTEHVHQYAPNVQAPTCSAPGYTVYICSCGENYMGDNVPALAHVYGEWVTTTAATCTNAGIQTRVCTACQTAETQAINPIGHKYVDTVTAPTKTTQGYTVHTCSVCKDSYTDSYTNATGSQGLTYEYNSDGTLTVTGMGICTDSEVIIYSTTAEGKSVTGIAAGAFANNTTIKSVYLPASITTIGEGAFAGCTALTTITVENDNKVFSALNGVLYSKDLSTVVAFPAGLKVTEYSVTNSIRDIRASAFAGCVNLTQFKLADAANKLFYVYDGVLYKLDANGSPSTLIAYPAGKTSGSFSSPIVTSTIGDYAFYGATKLTSINIDGVISVGAHAFENCRELISLTIPNTTRAIGEYAFASCSKLTAISFGEAITTINAHTFENCTSLRTVYMPDTILRIKEYAFNNCINLNTVMIGAGTREIGERAFMFCNSLSAVLYKGNATNWFSMDVHSSNNTPLTITATLYFFTTSTTNPSGSGQYFWHYDANGNPSITW